MGRLLGTSSLFRNFLGIFGTLENGLLILCVHFWGTRSIFA